MKSLTAKERKSITIDVNDHGFSVWISEINPNTGIRQRHWLLDGSLLLKGDNPSIELGNHDLYKYGAIYDKKTNCIKIVKK